MASKLDPRLAWGRRITNTRDEEGPHHLLNEDNSPACGVSYFTMTGLLYTDAEVRANRHIWVCRTCAGISERVRIQRERAERMAAHVSHPHTIVRR